MTESLRLIDGQGELQGVVDTTVHELEMELRAKRAQITKLKNEIAQLAGVAPEAKDITEVLEYWRELLMPNAAITVGSARWLKVQARLREKHIKSKQLRFSVLSLKAAVVGISLSRWHMDPSQPHRRDLDIAFSEGDRVERLINDAIGFKQRTGVSALAVVDELTGDGLAWLADRCICGHLRTTHLMGGLTVDRRFPCTGCDCRDMDDFTARVERWKREQA